MWRLVEQYTHRVGYHRGIKAAGLDVSPPVIDCSGWVGLLLTSAMNAQNVDAGKDIFDTADIAACVDLVNEAGTPTIVHWHGQLPPWKQDGFPWPQTPPVPAGDTGSYDYAPIAGTYWMHSHEGMQEQSLMTAPLIVRSAEDMRADRQEVVLLLHDFSFHTPDELLAALTKSNG
ncbi:MAG: hypothetical protein QOE02_5473, partial [Rhodospirillaceae bacterium]|nr:hypothetical protein [Rhodospirillaceae bacterium]